MPAVSKAQQKFMGMIHAAQKGDMENPSPEVAKAADSMSDKDAKDFASTPHKGLPDKIKEMVLAELRSVKAIQTEYTNTVDLIQKHLELYKKSKGTPEEKKHVQHLKTLNDKKKKLAAELEAKVSDLYKDAELKVDEMNTTGGVEGYNTPFAFSGKDSEEKKGKRQADLTGYSVVKESITNPKKSNPNDLATTVIGWYDFATDYIDDGGQRRRAEKSNENVVNWFASHPSDVKQKAFKVMLSKQPSIKSKIERIFGSSLKESVNEEKKYKKGDKLKIKLPNGKKIDVVFDMYARTKGVALGKFKDGSGEYDIKPFNLDTIVESVNEVGVNDWHFKEIKKLWDKAGSFTKKKIAALIAKNPNSNWSKIEDILMGSDYDDVTYYTDRLQLESVKEVKIKTPIKK